MWQLNLPLYNFRIKKQDEKLLIFDNLRKKFIVLTPEEWVRQNFIQFLIETKGFPASYIAVEKQITVNGLKKRFDALVYNANLNPIALIEFKAPEISINQSTFDQASVYNHKLNVEYFIISNGIEHYCCKIDKTNMKYDFLAEIPNYKDMI